MTSLLAGTVKSVLSALLDRFLKPYVDGFDSNNLDVGLWRGELKLKDLKIKKGALDNFRLPVDVIEGHLGDLSMSIPYTQLATKPVEVEIRDLYLLVRPASGNDHDPAEEDKRALAAKLERLENAEVLQSRTQNITEDPAQNQGFIQALTTKIVNNLQVRVKNIHIRYEDDLSCPGHPFAAGVTLAEFSAQTTDENWQAKYVDKADVFHKLATLESLSVYFDTDNDSIAGLPLQESLKMFESLIANRGRRPDHQYILQPVTGQGKIYINQKVDKSTPRFDAGVEFQELGFTLDNNQYRDIISMVDMYHFYVRQAQYRRYRPSEEAMKENPARARLKFAFDTIRRETHERNEKWTKAYVVQRREERQKYQALYLRKLHPDPNPKLHLTPEETSKLNAYEAKYSYEDLRYFRWRARAEWKKDQAARKAKEKEVKVQAGPSKQSAWGWSFWSSSTPTSQPADDTTVKAQQQELFQTIGYDEHAQPEDLTDETMKVRVTATLKKGSLSLRRKSDGEIGIGSEVLSVVFDASQAQVLQRVGTIEGAISLGSFSVYDSTSDGSLHHKIVRVKNEKEAAEPTFEIATVDVTKDPTDDPLFYAKVVQNPLDGHADSTATVRMKALEIVYHRGYVEAVAAFFRPPESQMESVTALLSAATETLSELRNQSRAALEYALDKHKTLDITLDMEAPIIIIPEDVRSKTGHHMILDAGHISVRSDLVPKSELNTIRSKKGRQYTDEDYAKLESLMYDKFFLKLESAQLVLGNDLDSCMAALTPDSGKQLHLVERTNMDFSVQSTIAPSATNLTRFKVSGKLPSLAVNFSNTKYKGLMRLIDIGIPKLNDDAVPAPAAEPAARPDPLKLPSNFFRKAEEFGSEDEDHPAVRGDKSSDHQDDDTFVDAESGTGESSQNAIHQRLFEFAFQVDKLQASLFRSVASGPDRLLADVLLEQLSLDFAMAQFDMQVKLTLRSLSLSRVDNADRTPLILSSEAQEDAATSKGGTDLVQVDYTRVQANSPEFMSVYEGIDQSVHVSLSTFIVHAAPEPIIDLYDFIMSTFVAGHTTPEDISPAQTPGQTTPIPPPPASNSGKMRVRVNLTKFEVVLLDSGKRLATLDLSAANTTVFLRGNTLRVGVRLGSLSIVDDSPLAAIDSTFKNIVSIDGDELADFTYESFDPAEKESFPGINSLVHLRFASLKVNFIEEPVRELYHFVVKFARLKALYDAASQAAAQRAAEITRMKFDILVRSPVIIFPSDPSTSHDVLAMKLGEIYASNSYSGPVATTSAGLRGIRLTSRLWYGEDLVKLKIIDDVEISSTIVQTADIDRKVELNRPDTAVEVKMSDVKISLTEAQYILIMQILQSIPRILATTSEATVAAEESSTAPGASRADSKETPEHQQPTVDMGPELSLTAHTDTGQEIARWSTIDLVFSIDAVRLQLFDKYATREPTLKESGIVRLSLNDNAVRFKMLSDGATQTEVILKSVTINNTRAGNSKFREIIPAAQHNRNQFMLLFTTTVGTSPSSSAVISIDSPKVIFAVDPVFALLNMLQSPFMTSDTPTEDSTDHPASETPGQDPAAVQSAMSLRVDLHDVFVSVLEQDDDPNTQAIQLTIKEIMMAQQGVLALTVNRLRMSLMSMNKPTEKVTFLDEIDITLTVDNRKTSGHQMMSVELTLQPIIFRASLRDINLITAIVSRGIELSSGDKKPQKDEKKRVASNVQPRPKGGRKSRASLPKSSARQVMPAAHVIMTTEKLKATFDGFRLILIGDIHELPLLHLNTKGFCLKATDWSSELQANTTVDTSITYWNLTNSHWEPLIDPWTFSVAVRKDVQTGALALTLAARERLDVNLTSAFIELGLTTARLLSTEGERVLKKARGGDAPYRIVNRTGTIVDVCSEADSKARGAEVQRTRLVDGSETEWRFDDWKTTRERVSSSRSNNIAIQFQGKPWEAVRNIPVDREGEYIYALRPPSQKVPDRLLIEITVKDNVKVVTLRSTYKLENRTLYPIDIVLVDSRGKPTYPLQKLSPGEDYSLPIDAVLVNDVQVRPDPGFGYGWPERPIRWQDLLRSPSQTISCPFKDAGAEVPFRFQAWGMYDSNDPINHTYPKMTLRLRAPIELENLLPFDIRYTIYDKDSQKKWRSYLRRGGLMPVHCVHLEQFVLFNAEIQETNFKPSEFAIINTDDSPDFSIESVLRVADQQDRRLDLGINYMKHEDSGGAFRLQVYSPFVAINKTGFPINIRSGNNKLLAGQVGNTTLSETTPFMFSHPKEQGAEFAFRLGDSDWSKVLNFEAPSAETAVILRPSTSSVNKQIHVGISWSLGLGKYKLSKVVTFAPRYMIKNELSREVLYRECGDTNSDAPIQPGRSTPIFAFASGREPALSLKYPGVDCKWTSPVNIEHIGTIHTRMTTSKQSEPDLARVEVSMGGPTIWITIKLESGAWPFTIENASDYTVEFSQTDERQTVSQTKYVVQPHSQARYAWDAPAVRDKKLRLTIDGVPRIVDIMEIGDLVPFRFKRGASGYGVVSLDVRADGETQTLTVSNYSEETSLYKRRPRAATIDSTLPRVERADTMNTQIEAFEAITEDIDPTLAITIQVDGIGISLINRRLVEVVYFTLTKLKVDYTNSPAAHGLQIVCGWIQIDNQLHEAIYPVLLQPMLPPREGNKLEVQPALQSMIIVLKDQSHGVLFIKYASILLQALSIQMDEDFLFALLDLTKLHNLTWETEEQDVLTEHPTDIPPPTAIQEGQDLYFEVLELQPMQLSLSFMRTERVNADEKLTLRNPLAVVLNAFTMTIGNVNDAPLRLNALAIKDMRLTVPVLQERIFYHYKQEVLRQVYRILGSADFIGNPVGLFTNVSSGVADIFYEPYKGVVMHGSKELGVGIAKGAASFAKKTIFGVTDSMTKVTSSIGKGLSAATFDAEYQRQRRLAQRKNRPGNAIFGVAAGAEALANSFSSGLEGVVMKPLEGAEREGAFGFFKGVGKGIVGALTKPAVGVFDLASNFTEGIRNTTTIFDNNVRNRQRIPRNIPADGILLPYSQRDAVGQAWLKDLDNGNYRTECYISYIQPSSGGDVVVMVTNKRIVSFYATKLRLRWDIPWTHVLKVDFYAEGLIIRDRNGREYDQPVPIPDESSRKWFYDEIEKVRKQWDASLRVER